MYKKIFTIAEIAQAHDGSLGILHSYIDALKSTGVNAIKFQTHIADAESSEFEPFRVKFSYQDKTRKDYWKRMEFSPEQWQEIKQHCEEAGLEFLSSPFSIEAVDLLEKLDVKKYKIGSGEVTNHLMLEKIARTGKDVVLSSGMSSYEELDSAVQIFKNRSSYSILQCTTEYPTTPQSVGLNIITELKKRYNVPVGFSDHSGDIYSLLAAASIGAEILEFHAVFDKRMFGPDAQSSLEIDRIKDLVKGVKYIEDALNASVNKNENQKFSELKNMFGKSLSARKNIKAGEQINFDDLEAKKPAEKGISANEYKNVIGKKASRDISKYEFINYKDIV